MTIEAYRNECGAELSALLPPVMQDDSIGVFSLFPTEWSWQHGNRTVTCIATSDAPRTGSLRG